MRSSAEGFTSPIAATGQGVSPALDVSPGRRSWRTCHQSLHFGGRIEELARRQRLGVQFADEIPGLLGIRLDHREVGVILAYHRSPESAQGLSVGGLCTP